MGPSVFEHPLLGGHFRDPDMAAILTPERQMMHMLNFEAAWLRACGKVGLFEMLQAEEAASAIERATVDFADIGLGMAVDGVPVPSLVKQLKAITSVDEVHRGATSQDVVDTAMVLALKEATNLIVSRLTEASTLLGELDEHFGRAPLMGRTRMQAATEITVSDRLAAWHLPLLEHLARLQQVRSRVERVQIGGAAGDRKALGDKGDAVVADVACALGLLPTQKAWHAMRDGIAEYASLLSLVTGTLGKIGQDVALMAQQGIDEIGLSDGGSSSAMPHKQNPVSAELLVTLARFNAVQVSAMHHAMLHEQERSGASWTLEWMVLPQMLMATGRSLSVAIKLFQNVTRIGWTG